MKAKTLAIAALLPFLAASASFAKGQAVVLASSGKVEWRETAASAWKPLGSRTVLQEGTAVLTGPASMCEIGFVDGTQSVVRVEPDSLALIASVDPVKIELQNGRVLSLVKSLKKDSSFIVATPTAVASVRGTGWEQSADRITVFDKAVHVEGKGGEAMDVNEGSGVPIAGDGDLGDPFQASAEAVEEWNGFKEAAAARLGDHLSDVLTDIGENDPTEDLFENKDAFEESVEQGVLDDKIQESKDDDKRDNDN